MSLIRSTFVGLFDSTSKFPKFLKKAHTADPTTENFYLSGTIYTLPFHGDKFSSLEPAEMWKRGFRETALIIKRNANLNLDRTFVSKVTVNPAFRWGEKKQRLLGY